MSNRSGDRGEMCGKTLIKSLSVRFYLGDITRVQCGRRLCCLWDLGAHTCFADSKQCRKAFESGLWVDGVGGSRWAAGEPRRVWGSNLLMSSFLDSAPWGWGQGTVALGWSKATPAGVPMISVGVPPSLLGDARRGRWECVCPKALRALGQSTVGAGCGETA